MTGDTFDDEDEFSLDEQEDEIEGGLPGLESPGNHLAFRLPGLDEEPDDRIEPIEPFDEAPKFKRKRR